MKVIPILVSAGITGFESPAQEYTQLALSLDDLLIEHPSSTFLCRAYGDSMENVGIFNQDLVIVDRSLVVRHLDVIVANFNGEFVCKLLDKHRKLLLSANEQMQPVPINDYDTFSIEGVVSRSIRCHRPSHLLQKS